MNEEIIEIRYSKITNNKRRYYKKYTDKGWEAEKIIQKLKKDENISTIVMTTYSEINKSIFYKIGGNN